MPSSARSLLKRTFLVVCSGLGSVLDSFYVRSGLGIVLQRFHCRMLRFLRYSPIVRIGSAVLFERSLSGT